LTVKKNLTQKITNSSGCHKRERTDRRGEKKGQTVNIFAENTI